jgi:hypothetical protein
MVDVMEISEVGIYLHHPIRLDQDDGPDEDSAPEPREEGLELHPRNDIVQTPGCVEKDGCHGQPPPVDWLVEEDEEACESVSTGSWQRAPCLSPCQYPITN